MLPTFVIGLREGLEAALIVGIVAAFLKQRGRRDLLRLVWFGVALATVVCLAVGVGLHVLSADLPQRQQEGLETVVGAIAVAMVTYMVMWMRRHSRELKQQLQGAADLAMESGSGVALVVMAFLAVFREGFETSVFLLAAFNSAENPRSAAAGAILGVAVAVALGYGIYRGGIRLNLSKFFRVTGLVLVLVAAGLVVSALHTAHEAGWLTVGQGRTVDLTWLVTPGSVQASLLTGMLGWQPQPVLIELIGWLAYLIPVGVYVAWPPGRPAPARAVIRFAAGTAAVAGVAGLLATVLAPHAPVAASTTRLAVAVTNGRATNGGATSAVADPSVGSAVEVRILARTGDRLTVTTAGDLDTATWTLTRSVAGTRAGRAVDGYSVTGVTVPTPAGLPARGTLAQITALNGGRLPLGVRPDTEATTVALHYASAAGLTVWLDSDTGRILDVTFDRRTSASADLSVGPTVLGVVRSVTAAGTPAAVAAAAGPAEREMTARDRADLLRGLAGIAWTITGLAILVVLAALGALRKRPAAPDRSAMGPGGAAGAESGPVRSASVSAASAPRSRL